MKLLSKLQATGRNILEIIINQYIKIIKMKLFPLLLLSIIYSSQIHGQVITGKVINELNMSVECRKNVIKISLLSSC